MVDWMDPEVIVYVFFLYEQIAVFLLGFYGAQFIWTLHIEWELITKKRAFRAVHVPWLLARYMTLSALLFFVVTGRLTTRIACDVAYRMYASLGSAAAMFASWILCMRPASIFRSLKEYIPLATLVVIGTGQGFFAILQGILTVRAKWNDHTESCEIVHSDSTVLAIFYLYTFGYDVVILAMTLYAVQRVRALRPCGAAPWRVGDALCVQGIGYVAVTCVANVPVGVLAVLNLNAGMNVLLSLPAVTVSVLAASLAVFALGEFGNRDSADGTTSERGEAPFTTHLSMNLTALRAMDSGEVFDDDLRGKTSPGSTATATASPTETEVREPAV